MENIVKDENSIINQSKNSSGGFDYVLKNGTWLGDSFNFLPSGIIDKRETGIGATTLEIKCNRDSIIIEPLKSTVKQKTDGKDDIFPYLVENLSVSEDLTNYLQRHQHKPKKIMLVYVVKGFKIRFFFVARIFFILISQKTFIYNFCVSIDGTGPVFEYLRYPLDWALLESNLKFLGIQRLCRSK
jgi:hypothetical protein